MMRLYTDVFFLILGFPNLPCTQVYTKTKPFQTGYNENKKLYDRQTKMSGKTEWWCKISFCVCTFCRKLSKKKLLNYFFNAANRVINAFLFYFYFIIIFLISDLKKKIIFFFYWGENLHFVRHCFRNITGLTKCKMLEKNDI